MTTRRLPTPTRADTRLDQLLDGAILAGLTVLILVGFTTSYRTLRDLATTVGGYPEWLAPAVPLSFDLGIVVLSLKVARAAREGRTAPILRLLVGALSATTVVANASAAATWAAGIMHAVPPAMFVICFESVIGSARRHALALRGLMPEPLPRLRITRWLLAPRATWDCWRSLILYPGAEPSRHRSVETHTPKSAAPTSLRPSTTSTPPATTPPLPDHRLIAIRELLQGNPQISTKQIVAELEADGYALSLRTAQRLRMRAAGGKVAASTPVALRAIRH